MGDPDQRAVRGRRTRDGSVTPEQGAHFRCERGSTQRHQNMLSVGIDLLI